MEKNGNMNLYTLVYKMIKQNQLNWKCGKRKLERRALLLVDNGDNTGSEYEFIVSSPRRLTVLENGHRIWEDHYIEDSNLEMLNTQFEACAKKDKQRLSRNLSKLTEE